MKGKAKRFCSLAKCRHHANGLLQSISFLCGQSRIIWKKKTANQIKRQTNKTKIRTQINSRDFLIWQFPNFFWKGILLTCWQMHSAKALPLHCWHWGYWIYGQSMVHSWRDLLNSAHLLHCYFFLPQQLQKKNGTLLNRVGIPNSVAPSRCLHLVQAQFHKLCFSIFERLKQEGLLDKLV